ncbi:MAG TPA: hypothetical protein VHE55_16505 [Fimbriimonadaceae bacterium]|nr:hypothetical protein [Fimbriimonadaceae bacterium]
MGQNDYPDGNPWGVSATGSGSVDVKLTWKHPGVMPPPVVYVLINSSSACHFGTGAIGGASADNGLNFPAVVTQGNDYINADSMGARGVQEPVSNDGTVQFTISLSSSASGTGYKLTNASVGFSPSVVPTTRVAVLTSNLDPTYRRDANGIPVRNVPDASGCMYGDTSIQGLREDFPGVFWSQFDFDISRSLLGYWPHTADDQLFNEWWRDYPAGYWSDGAVSENTDLWTDWYFSDYGDYISVQSLRGAPYTGTIKYRVTDQVDGFTAQTNYFMRIHAPCELTGATWQSPYAGDLWQCPEPIGDFHPLLLAFCVNNLDHDITATFTVSDTRSYTYSSGNAEHGSAGIEAEGIKLQLGIDERHDTSEQYARGKSVSMSTTVHPGETVYLYLHAAGHATFPIGSKYDLHGFAGDGNLWKAYYDGWGLDVRNQVIP